MDLFWYPVGVKLNSTPTLVAAMFAAAWLVNTVEPLFDVVEYCEGSKSTLMSQLVVPGKTHVVEAPGVLSDIVNGVPIPIADPAANPEVLAVVMLPKLMVLLPAVVEAASPKSSTQVVALILAVNFNVPLSLTACA